MAIALLRAILMMALVWGINLMLKDNLYRDSPPLTYDSLIHERDQARFYEFTEPRVVGVDECQPE